MPRKIRNILLVFLFLLSLYGLLRVVFFYLYYPDLLPGGALGAGLESGAVAGGDGFSTAGAGPESSHSGSTKDFRMYAAVFYWGMRLDFAALFYLQLPFLLYYFFIHELLRPRVARITAVALLLALHLPFLALNCLDLVYFQFTQRRSTVDLLSVWRDSLPAAGVFYDRYWPFVLFFVGMVLVCGWVFYRLFGLPVSRLNPSRPTPPSPPRALAGSFPTAEQGGKLGRMRWANLLAFLLVAVPGAVLARGWATTPLMPYTPLLQVAPRHLPLATNSTATFLYSLVRRQTRLRQKDYDGLSAADRVSPRLQLEQEDPFRARNVIVFVLESFCGEYLRDGSSYRASTPFLDSLIGHSTRYSEAYANGLISNQGLVATLGSLPSFTDEPYYYSMYSSNRMRGIGSLLKEKGYSTHFFMGAPPDHYGFGKLCRMLGIDRYHSEADYPDKRFHDGVWGIYDHKFLPFAARELDREELPFFAVLFNLSSHFPFRVPPGLADRFAGLDGPSYKKAVSYVDYSLSEFFSQARQSPWYANTIFYFIADHSILNVVGEEVSRSDFYNIPFFVFDPAEPVGQEVKGAAQQLDLVPTILDGLSYPEPFMSFGRSLHRPGNGYLITRYDEDLYLFRADSLELHYSGQLEAPVYLYDLRSNEPRRNRLGEREYTQARERLVARCRGFLASYHEALINDRLYIK